MDWIKRKTTKSLFFSVGRWIFLLLCVAVFWTCDRRFPLSDNIPHSREAVLTHPSYEATWCSQDSCQDMSYAFVARVHGIGPISFLIIALKGRLLLLSSSWKCQLRCCYSVARLRTISWTCQVLFTGAFQQFPVTKAHNQVSLVIKSSQVQANHATPRFGMFLNETWDVPLQSKIQHHLYSSDSLSNWLELDFFALCCGLDRQQEFGWVGLFLGPISVWWSCWPPGGRPLSAQPVTDVHEATEQSFIKWRAISLLLTHWGLTLGWDWESD